MIKEKAYSTEAEDITVLTHALCIGINPNGLLRMLNYVQKFNASNKKKNNEERIIIIKKSMSSDQFLFVFAKR